jgi:predicted nucleic acid-binding protein
MTLYYADTSALVKRYVDEVGSTWMREQADPQTGHSLMTSRMTEVETFSVLNRRRRGVHIGMSDYELIASDIMRRTDPRAGLGTA